ncbi:LacI family DNA-binding transcriptional regulator [Amycolatopsis sp. Hca4]|uniref:LacI family DNA-binding transcriptional regulator n=1 Tax=unclassified Amycolatopsis TaxID=2618356 RepID=UPI00159111C3|nr:LacI family DNA-binding transcriptional regulator [Amycolatopsis sp. Hca4]QKV79891.1 LacI family DNA-binding transcriptional regulator [Amycolatopsis sp. Hca4]
MTVLDLSDPRPTLADVARAAGVSSATASRVLNGFPQVRAETRRQVEQAVRALGYVRQRAARAGEAQRTGTVAVVLCEDGLRLFSDPFFGRIMGGIDRTLTAAGIQVVVLMMQAAAQDTTFRYLAGGHVDGALFVSTHARSTTALSCVDLPVVSAGRPVVPDPARYTYVDVDNRGGAEAAVRHLQATGRRRIATVAGPKDMAPGRDRLTGYLTAIAGAGPIDAGAVAHGDFGQASGEHAMRRLLDRRPDLDAVFVASDMMAVGALRALRRTGRRVPDDVAVVGFDNSPVSRTTDPPLTTVSQPVDALGARSAGELLAAIDGTARRPRRVVLGTTLVVRESA